MLPAAIVYSGLRAHESVRTHVAVRRCGGAGDDGPRARFCAAVILYSDVHFVRARLVHWYSNQVGRGQVWILRKMPIKPSHASIKWQLNGVIYEWFECVRQATTRRERKPYMKFVEFQNILYSIPGWSREKKRGKFVFLINSNRDTDKLIKIRHCIPKMLPIVYNYHRVYNIRCTCAVICY